MKLTAEDKDNIIVALQYFIDTRKALGLPEGAVNILLRGYQCTLSKFES